MGYLTWLKMQLKGWLIGMTVKTISRAPLKPVTLLIDHPGALCVVNRTPLSLHRRSQKRPRDSPSGLWS